MLGQRCTLLPLPVPIHEARSLKEEAFITLARRGPHPRTPGQPEPVPLRRPPSGQGRRRSPHQTSAGRDRYGGDASWRRVEKGSRPRSIRLSKFRMLGRCHRTVAAVFCQGEDDHRREKGCLTPRPRHLVLDEEPTKNIGGLVLRARRASVSVHINPTVRCHHRSAWANVQRAASG